MSRETRLDRKALKNPDSFVKQGRAVLEAVLGQKQYVVAGVAALLLAVVAYNLYTGWRSRVLERGWAAVYDAEQGKAEERIEALKKVADENRSRAGYIAAVSVADFYLKAAAVKAERQDRPATKAAKAGKEEALVDPVPDMSLSDAADAAAQWYSKSIGFSSLLPYERELLGINLGQASELKGDYLAALDQYGKVADARGEQRALGLIHSGRMQELLGEKAKAKQAYESVFGEYGGTEYARLARNYLRRMDSPLLGASAGQP